MTCSEGWLWTGAPQRGGAQLWGCGHTAAAVGRVAQQLDVKAPKQGGRGSCNVPCSLSSQPQIWLSYLQLPWVISKCESAGKLISVWNKGRCKTYSDQQGDPLIEEEQLSLHPSTGLFVHLPYYRLRLGSLFCQYIGFRSLSLTSGDTF